MIKTKFNILFTLVMAIGFSACENVKEGYRIDYDETPAEFSVELVTPDRGAIGDSIAFAIKVNSNADIQSLAVTTSISGGEGTGYKIYEGMEDPLIDHAYGTVQDGTRKIEMNYNYMVRQDTLDASLSFTLVDDLGKKTIVKDVYAVPSVVKYDSIVLYTQTSDKADGFSTLDGMVYRNLFNYTDITAANEAIHESIDIIPIVNSSTAMLVAPYNGSFTGAFTVNNKTLFALISGVSDEDFNNLTSATLSAITEENRVKGGATFISDIKVGDIIGFRTDFASANPYRYGLIRINAIHPTLVENYVGKAYLIEMDIATQK